MTTHRLVEALARLDNLRREQLDWLSITEADEPQVECHPHPYCGPAFTGPLAADVPMAQQIEELTSSGLLGTIAVDSQGAVHRLRLWATPKERRAWETRVQLAHDHPHAAELLSRGGAAKLAQWRRDQALQQLHETIWAADAALGDQVSASDLLDTSQISRATYYRFLRDRPEGYTPPTLAVTPAAAPAQPAAPQPAAPTAEAPTEPDKAAPAPRKVPSQPRAPKGPHRHTRGAQMHVTADEVRALVRWAEKSELVWSEARATEALERWHACTGFQWTGTHGVITAALAGNGRWPGSKNPRPADLGLYRQLATDDDFWAARSWMLTPGELDEAADVIGCDVNAQYVAAASSVMLGEGDPLHYVPGEPLPEKYTKLPGWVRLGKAVRNAPHGLHLDEALWLPTPLAEYLTRDKGITLDVSEALLWGDPAYPDETGKRTALATLAGTFKGWLDDFKSGTDQADHDALTMAKAVYTRALGGYLASEDNLTAPVWRRPDWARLIKAQAEANFLRALDKLPEGCTPRAKYADAVFIEVAPGADLSTWPQLDTRQPGKFKLMGTPVSAGWFLEDTTPDEWRKTYALGGQ